MPKESKAINILLGTMMNGSITAVSIVIVLVIFGLLKAIIIDESFKLVLRNVFAILVILIAISSLASSYGIIRNASTLSKVAKVSLSWSAIGITIRLIRFLHKSWKALVF